MARRCALLGMLAMMAIPLFAWQTASADEPTSLVRSDDAGPQVPPAGRSLFDELFATGSGHDIPYPFERLVGAVNARLAPAAMATALIPLGRSLQRFDAAPDFFRLPRLVLAADGDGAGTTADPLLRDRLYLGYQPAANAIEVISYNEAAGRFEFQRVLNYGDGLTPQVDYADRSICTGCHQGHGPIFPRPLWSETNANPQIAARLRDLGVIYHGAPVHQGIDGPDRFDRSTDRANRIAVVNRLWDEGCGGDGEGVTCRAALLRAALEYRLSGSSAYWRSSAPAESERLQQRLTELWPAGLAVPSPDLPNRDPLAAFADAATRSRPLEVSGAADPLTPRALLLEWQADGDAAATFDALAREIAGAFAAADIAWLDAGLRSSAQEDSEVLRAVCRIGGADRDRGRKELRFSCGGGPGAAGLEGFVILNGAKVESGRIDRLSLDGTTYARLLTIDGATATLDNEGRNLRAIPRESGAGLSARLPDLRRVTGLSLEIDDHSQGVLDVQTTDDMEALDDAVRALTDMGAPSLDTGPLRRRALLADLQRALTAH